MVSDGYAILRNQVIRGNFLYSKSKEKVINMDKPKSAIIYCKKCGMPL